MCHLSRGFWGVFLQRFTHAQVSFGFAASRSVRVKRSIDETKMVPVLASFASLSHERRSTSSDHTNAREQSLILFRAILSVFNQDHVEF